MEKSPRESIARTALILTISGLFTAGCFGDEAPTPPPTTSYSQGYDRDGDGAWDSIDPYPYTANPTDWDADGIRNEFDASPFTPNLATTPPVVTQPNTQVPATSGQTVPNTVGTVPGCLNDRDCDGVPDSQDPYPDVPDPGDAHPNNTQPPDDDWDDDFLPNYRDKKPHDPDRDRDGKLDGLDPDPDNPNDSVNEPTDDDPYTDDKDADNDGVDDKYDSDPRDPYES